MPTPVFACITPHPPILIPEVGLGQQQVTQETIDAYSHLREKLAAAAPDTLIVISSHGPVQADHFTILEGRLEGSLQSFRAPEVAFQRESDSDLVRAVLAAAEQHGLPLQTVAEWNPDDHATWVPLYYLGPGAPQARVVMITISAAPPQAHYALGQAASEAIAMSDRRVAIIASADGAHALHEQGPYGFHPAAPRWEEEFKTALVAWDVERVLAFDEDYRRQAAEDSVPSVAFLMGALAGREVQVQILASEAPWGVGYTTALVTLGASTGSPTVAPIAASPRTPTLVRLAREAVEAHIRDGSRVRPTSVTDPAWERQRAGAFVTIEDDQGDLRGCIGTVQPVEVNVLEEIVSNGIAAATRDPRFLPVQTDELSQLRYKVDVLMEPEPIAEIAELDPRRFGVIVEAGRKRGLLLPDLEGIDTAEEQVRIAREKGGIRPDELVQLLRFRVQRFEE